MLHAQTMTVHLSGTVTEDSTGLPVANHEVVIRSDSSSGFVFYATRYTNPNGFYDCTINNVPTASAVAFFVSTHDCHNNVITHDFLSTASPATVNFVICVPPPCQAAFDYHITTVGPLTYEFIDASTSNASIVSWLWEFGDPASGSANTSSLQDAVHTFSAPGFYTVCLYINTSNGCTSHFCQTVHAGTPPCQASFIFIPDSLHPNMIRFFDTSIPQNLITTWLWDFGDGNTSYGQTAQHVYTVPGYYHVCHTIATSTGCSSTTCDTVHVGTPPPNCENNYTMTSALLTVTFHGMTNSPYPTVYTWHMGDPASTTLTGQDISFTYPATGAYNVVLNTVDSTGCQWTRTTTVYVHETTDLNGHGYMGIHPVDHGWIELIRIDSNNVMTVVQAKEFGDSLAYFHFGGVTAGSYYLKAQLLPSSTRYGHFMPTYYEQSLSWQSAQIIVVTQSQDDKNIHLVECTPAAPGNGNITGRITQGGVKFSGRGAGLPDIEVMLLDPNNNPLGYTKTDTGGNFSFANIAYGTYNIKPEKAGMTSSGAQTTIDNSHPTVILPFTISNGQILYGINDPGAGISFLGELYPNPAPGQKVSFRLNCTKTVSISYKLFNSLGQAVLGSQLMLESGANTVEIDISGLKTGPYYLKIQTADDKVVIRKLTVFGE